MMKMKGFLKEALHLTALCVLTVVLVPHAGFIGTALVLGALMILLPFKKEKAAE
jgi:hypothetical protein